MVRNHLNVFALLQFLLNIYFIQHFVSSSRDFKIHTIWYNKTRTILIYLVRSHKKRNTDCPKRIKIFLDKNYNSDDNINCLKGIPYNLGINIINIFYCNT